MSLCPTPLLLFLTFVAAFFSFMFSLRSSLILSLAFTSGVFAQSAAELVAKLRAAPSSNDRLKMLDDKDVRA